MMRHDKKILASIDFSINSTSMLVFDGSYHWYHFGREKTSYFDLGTKSFTRSLLPKRVKGEDYCKTERMKIIDARQVCQNIVKVMSDRRVTHVAFEGHSFNSKGNSLLELVSYQFLLRNMIITYLVIDETNMFFYPPITVKSFAGGAKFKKKDMLDAFIKTNDDALVENEVHRIIRSSLDSVLKGEDVVKPVDDVIDSYWILKKLQQDV
jgi:hypothetical protein